MPALTRFAGKYSRSTTGNVFVIGSTYGATARTPFGYNNSSAYKNYVGKTFPAAVPNVVKQINAASANPFSTNPNQSAWVVVGVAFVGILGFGIWYDKKRRIR